ncbi:MAG: hypothetical protein IT182_11735 [Acidobacteria bacterium]|nr:hypothetical protein [Acidobacteriota bacterium]
MRGDLPAMLRYPAGVLTASGLVAMLVGCLVGVAAVGAFVIWRKGRPFAAGDVFRASRLSAGNRLLPVQVHITPTSVVHYTPQWVGRLEHSIHMAHVASVRIDTNMFFSDVFIETTGGVNPIRCAGHRKKDALRMKALIEACQTDYYKQRPGA